jgi:MYXO-CTERM domain-containing protein
MSPSRRLRRAACCAVASVLPLTAGVSLAAPGFGSALSDNTTGLPPATFTGAPDGVFAGLGAQSLTYDFGDWVVANRPGAVDLNVYEVNFGGPEFEFVDVQASSDGVSYVSLSASESAIVGIAGDEAHGGGVFGRSYDLGALPWARFVRLVGTGNGDAGGTNYFDLDALGAHELLPSPVPEPQTWLMLAAGLGTLGLWRRRHG